MMNKDSLSMDKILPVLDNSPTAIYVCAVDSLELLYANQAARDLFLSRPDSQGLTCYQAAGLDAPCSFCRAKAMRYEKLLVREFYHPLHKRTYRLSGKLIDWDGKPAHIEYVLDITAEKQEKERDLRVKEELESIFHAIPCGLCVYQAKDGRIFPVFHNPAFYEVMGYSEEHIRSVEQKTDFLGVHPEDVEQLSEKIETVVRGGGVMRHTYRFWNDRLEEYRFIQLEGTARTDEEGRRLLYGIYSDVSGEKRLEEALGATNERLENTINAIPGGVAIYKVSDIFETVYFSDGVPELSGYTVAEYRELMKGDAAAMTYPEDTAMVVGKLREAIRDHTVVDFEFRKQHRDGHVVWVHIQAKQIGEDGGFPLLQCVFHNISALKETQLRMDHLVNSIPGGIASYRVEEGRFVTTYYSDGIPMLTGHTREEYEAVIQDDAVNIVYEPDRERILTQAQSAIENGTVLEVSYRIKHKDGSLIWVHLNGRRMGTLSEESVRFYAVITGMSAETRLFQEIANESADGIYVIDKESYELQYANESKQMFAGGAHKVGEKCYQALFGKDAPCEFCTLKTHAPDGKEHDMPVDRPGRFYTTSFRETDWNGVPVYVKPVRDVTGEVSARREKEKLELYYQALVKNLPGGIAVARCEPDGRLALEFLSEGFADMMHTGMEEARSFYEKDIFAGIHPDDVAEIRERLLELVEQGEGRLELKGRIKNGGRYIWVKAEISMLRTTDDVRRLYFLYSDITKAVEEQDTLRRQYEELILQHYRTPGPDTLMLGHCDITEGRILEVWDSTDSDLLKTFGRVREEFFTGLSGLVIDKEERQTFLNTYLNAPSLEAFARNETEHVLRCFVQLPKEEKGRYVEFKMNLVTSPDTGNVTGILTVTDITEQTISERILHQLSVTSYDLVLDIDLNEDRYQVLSCGGEGGDVPEKSGRHSDCFRYMVEEQVLPKDRGNVAEMLDTAYLLDRLKRDGAYSFSYAITGEKGDVLTKKLTVSATDLRLGRICLARTDITDSVREQQGLLNTMAYTFELMGLIEVGSGRLTMYTRETVLQNLPPYREERYDEEIQNLNARYGMPEDRAEVDRQFSLSTMLERLEKEPAGYDFLFPYRGEDGLRYKQVGVLWGDENHRTICLVRADVTDILTAERNAKKELEDALALAEEANRAKSDFLSAMSHDIRTPMNAIKGMTTLALARPDDGERVKGCLQKIDVANKHLLSLVNDILDMSRIERSKIALNEMDVSLDEILEQLSDIMEPQAREAGLTFTMQKEGVTHEAFRGDFLRLSQILNNLLSNAVKFTPEGGRVEFLVEELPAARGEETIRYRFTVRDTGIGMSEDFLSQIFEPFARSRGTARIEGTGLGLSIVKRLVDLMGGSITVESKEQEGSVFRVELEFAAASEKNSEGSESAEIDGTGEEKPLDGHTFLVAEDHPVNAELISELLKMFGVAAVVKPDGAQAVQEFQNKAPGTYDAVLMDIQMPVMDGYEAARAIRALDRPDTKKIPIIAMTANAFAEDVQAALDAGMNAHVSKPIDVEVLRKTLVKELGI